jgi:hypothetical protein
MQGARVWVGDHLARALGILVCALPGGALSTDETLLEQGWVRARGGGCTGRCLQGSVAMALLDKPNPVRHEICARVFCPLEGATLADGNDAGRGGVGSD